MKRLLINQDDKEIRDSIANYEAIPELAFKKEIFDEHNFMAVKRSAFSLSIKDNNGQFDPYIAEEYLCAIIRLFNSIEFMALKQKIMSLSINKKPGEPSDFMIIRKLGNNSYKLINYNKLFQLDEYVRYCMHKLKFTDLTIYGGVKDIDEEMKKW